MIETFEIRVGTSRRTSYRRKLRSWMISPYGRFISSTVRSDRSISTGRRGMSKRSASALFLIYLFVARPGAAQVGTDGSILGTVRDSSGAVIPGADVTIKNLETGLTKMAVTDQDGYFEVLALPRGSYSATVALASFKTWRQQPIELTVGELKRIEPVLAV